MKIEGIVQKQAVVLDKRFVIRWTKSEFQIVLEQEIRKLKDRGNRE